MSIPNAHAIHQTAEHTKEEKIVCLVYTLEGRNRLALSLVQGVGDDTAVRQINLAVWCLLETESVLHPVLVVTVGVIFTGVGTTRLLTVGGGDGGLGTVKSGVSNCLSVSDDVKEYLRASEQVAELKSLNKVRVPDHAAVLDTDMLELLVDLVHLADTLVQTLLSTEDTDISLHGLLHGQADLSGALGAVRVADLVEDLNVVSTSIGSKRLQLGTGGEVVADGVRNGTAKDDQVEKRVGTETVSTVDRHASSFTTSEQTRDNLVLALLVNSENLTSVASGNTTHVVVHSGKNGNRLLADIHTRENTSSLRDTRETLSKNLRRQVAKLQVNVVLLGTNTTAITDFHSHRSGNDITRSKILGGRGITLHETLTLGVEQVTTLTTSTLSDQASSTVDTGRMELNELKILVGETSASNHGHTVTSASVGRRAAEVGTPITTSSENSVVGEETVEGSVFLVVGEDTTALSVLHDQIEGEELNEVVGVVAERLAVQGVKKSVTGSVSGSAASVSLATLAVILRLTTESTLVTKEPNC